MGITAEAEFPFRSAVVSLLLVAYAALGYRGDKAPVRIQVKAQRHGSALKHNQAESRLRWNIPHGGVRSLLQVCASGQATPMCWSALLKRRSVGLTAECFWNLAELIWDRLTSSAEENHRNR